MDLSINGFLLMAAIFGYFVNGDSVVTPGDIKAYMGHRVELPCKYTPSDRSEWMFIRWKRKTDNGYVNIASMQNKVFSADWASTVPENFRDHVELLKAIGEDKYNLDLVIDGFICSDVGTYVCEVFTMSSNTAISSSTTLDIESHPGSPSIVEDTIEMRENDTYRIECKADVGIPAHTITWASANKESPHIYLKVLDGFIQENTKGPECTFRGTSVLTVTMTEALDGTTYMCSTSSELAEDGKPLNFDEVVVMLIGKSTTTQSTTTTVTEKSQYSAGDGGSASSVSSSLSAILLTCSFMTIFQLLARQT